MVNLLAVPAGCCHCSLALLRTPLHSKTQTKIYPRPLNLTHTPNKPTPPNINTPLTTNTTKSCPQQPMLARLHRRPFFSGLNHLRPGTAVFPSNPFLKRSRAFVLKPHTTPKAPTHFVHKVVTPFGRPSCPTVTIQFRPTTKYPILLIAGWLQPGCFYFS